MFGVAAKPAAGLRQRAVTVQVGRMHQLDGGLLPQMPQQAPLGERLGHPSDDGVPQPQHPRLPQLGIGGHLGQPPGPALFPDLGHHAAEPRIEAPPGSLPRGVDVLDLGRFAEQLVTGGTDRNQIDVYGCQGRNDTTGRVGGACGGCGLRSDRVSAARSRIVFDQRQELNNTIDAANHAAAGGGNPHVGPSDTAPGPTAPGPCAAERSSLRSTAQAPSAAKPVAGSGSGPSPHRPRTLRRRTLFVAFYGASS